jgi:excisionase family DNA binding protein
MPARRKPHRTRTVKSPGPTPVASPWLTLAQAAAYLHRGRRFVRDEIRQGRLRAALVGGRHETLTCTAWLDEYVQAQSAIVPLLHRQRTAG